MDFAAVFKFNPNHDETNGEFATGAGGGSARAGRVGTQAHAQDPFKGIYLHADFKDRADALYKAAGKTDWEKTAPKADLKQLKKDYFGDGYEALNAWMRLANPEDHSTNTGQKGAAMDRMSAAIDKYGVTIPEGTELYRGIANVVADGGTMQSDFLKSLDKLKKGQTFKDAAFVSTTPMKAANLAFFGTTMLRIHTATPLQAMLRSGGDESEVLFKRNRTFTFRGKKKEGPLTYYDVDMS